MNSMLLMLTCVGILELGLGYFLVYSSFRISYGRWRSFPFFLKNFLSSSSKFCLHYNFLASLPSSYIWSGLPCYPRESCNCPTKTVQWIAQGHHLQGGASDSWLVREVQLQKVWTKTRKSGSIWKADSRGEREGERERERERGRGEGRERELLLHFTHRRWTSSTIKASHPMLLATFRVVTSLSSRMSVNSEATRTHCWGTRQECTDFAKITWNI